MEAENINRLIELLQGLPDQLMAVLLVFLTVKTFLDMVR